MSRQFDVNHPLLFILAGLAVLYVLAQSLFFLIRAWRRARELGFSAERLRKQAISSAVFSIAPAVGIGIGVLTLAGSLGLALPWVRLSVVGSISYELVAAQTAASALGTTLGSVLTAKEFSTIAWIMTVGISEGLIVVPIMCKRLVSGVEKIGQRDRAWGGYFSTAILLGLVSTFMAYVISYCRGGPAGWVSVLVFICSAIIMCICGLLRKLFNWKWINDYALPISMVGSMALAIPLTALVVG